MIGKRLKEIREQTGMNKKEFANFLGIKYTTYNNYETEAREPASDFLKLISSKFDVSIDYLLGMNTEKDILHSYELKASEYNFIEKFRSLDSFGQETVGITLDRESKRLEQLSQRDSQIAELKSHSASVKEFPSAVRDPQADHLVVDAAHARTDIEIPEGADTSDDDIMDDENF